MNSPSSSYYSEWFMIAQWRVIKHKCSTLLVQRTECWWFVDEDHILHGGNCLNTSVTFLLRNYTSLFFIDIVMGRRVTLTPGIFMYNIHYLENGWTWRNKTQPLSSQCSPNVHSYQTIQARQFPFIFLCPLYWDPTWCGGRESCMLKLQMWFMRIFSYIEMNMKVWDTWYFNSYIIK